MSLSVQHKFCYTQKFGIYTDIYSAWKETWACFMCMSYFECLSVTVPRIYPFQPKFREVFLVRNWVLLYMNENAKRCTQLRQPLSYRFNLLLLSFTYLVQIDKVFKIQ